MKHVDEDNRKYDYGVDVSIVKINFANNVVQDKVFKNRLNKLTNVKVCQNEQDNVNANLFIGGFPYTTFADSDNIRFTFFNFNIVNVFQYQTLETGNSDEANQGG
jgi:alkyl hydroperoxide reductase subunit AhpF